ncbi:hypothetical protein B0T26DRAFT_634822 [Lasiosphaeria miniovina]|uniref:HD/PDEase domain-containing protein n=1 Tax=Lasiosphaeria miniovina TaxID=1954250 RepID=A0AA40BJ09_9PEZI|nr:uncharacterized protein B0T26DRAFT_634822 [Lasiosphaeria miniovina]KAK0735088.1 hypothetical protein B0T26DRAFT_634822 [Lasiosphaeria miniovina]
MCGAQVSDGAHAGTGTIMASVRAVMPNHPACAEALAMAKSSLPASILYHSFRVYLFAQAFARLFQDNGEPSPPPPSPLAPGGQPDSTASAAELPHALFVACILHDVGTAAEHDAVPERFEIVGADVAARLLRAHDTPEPAVREAWLAISLHTSPGIAERLGGAVRALRLAVRADFGSYPAPPPESLPGGANLIRWKLPRLEIEKDLGNAVVRQALADPQKAPAASWPADLLRAKRADPGWEGVNGAF